MIQRMKPFAKTLSALLFTCAASAAQAHGFSSPSGNIRCYLDVYSDVRFDEKPMVCLVFGADWTPPDGFGDEDPTCDLDMTRTVILPRNGPATARWTCHGDVFWPEPLGSISYGSQWSLLGFSCDVKETGVQCRNEQGNSLSVSRARLGLN